MASQWNAAHDHDSRSFSDDYNLHGASQRSLDHPSVTRDDILLDGGWGPGDDDGDDDDMVFGDRADLIADIVDGRPPRLYRQQSSRLSGGGGSRIGHRQQDEAAYGQFYMVNDHGTHEQWHGTVPHQEDLHLENEDHEADHEDMQQQQQQHLPTNGRSLPLPRMQRRFSRASSGHSTVTREHYASASRALNSESEAPLEKTIEPKQLPRPALKSSNAKPKQERRIQLPLEDDCKTMTPTVASTVPAVGSESATMGQETSSLPALKAEGHADKLVAAEATMSPATAGQSSTSNNKTDPSKSAAFKQSSIPVPGRFTRITPQPSQKAQDHSPAKKPVATIPTPPSGNEVAQEAVRELRQLLNRFGFKVTPALDNDLEALDAAQLEKGGMCDLMNVVKKIGKMYDERGEVIHQMTDQIIAAHEAKEEHSDSGDNSESERILASQAEEIEAFKEQLNMVQDANRRLKEEIRLSKDEARRAKEEARMANEAVRTAEEEARAAADNNHAIGEQLRATKDKLSQLQHQQPKQYEQRTLTTTTAAVSEASSTPTALLLQDHLANIDRILQQRLETEIQRLMDFSKTAQSQQHQHALQQQRETAQSTNTLANQLDSIEQKIDHLQISVDGSRDAVLDRMDLLPSSALVGTHLASQTNGATQPADHDMAKRMKEQDALLSNVMACFGVQASDQLHLALQDIDQILRELSKLRKFIARVEKIIWDTEIAEGTVLVRSESLAMTREGSVSAASAEVSRAAEEGESGDNDGAGKETKDQTQSSKSSQRRRTQVLTEEPAGSAFRPGRTCTQSLDATLQRLREWSELLDVLNHVELHKGLNSGPN